MIGIEHGWTGAFGRQGVQQTGGNRYRRGEPISGWMIALASAPLGSRDARPGSSFEPSRARISRTQIGAIIGWGAATRAGSAQQCGASYLLSVATQLIDFRLATPVPTIVVPSAEMASGVINVTELGMFAPKLFNLV